MDVGPDLAWLLILTFSDRLTLDAVGIGGIVLRTYRLFLYSSSSSSLVYGQTLDGNVTIYDAESSRL